MTRRTTVLSVLMGLLLLIGAPVGWWVGQPPETVGDLTALPSPTPAELLAPAPTPRPASPPLAERDPVPEPRQPPELPSLPTSIRVPAIGVDAPIVRVGLASDGGMEIPEDVDEIGWYELGPLPGERGTAVVAGHVDSRRQGRGAFFELRRLAVDDLITLTHEDDVTSEWRVVARTAYPKTELPIADIFTRSSPTRLVLITCGGAFDSDTRHYRENIVVYAEPVIRAPST